MFCCFIHSDLGIDFTLYRQQLLARRKNQIYLLIVEAILGFRYIFCDTYHFYMFLLTLDRFLFFYSSIKYTVHCKSKKLLKIPYTVVTFATIISLTLVVLFQYKVENFWTLGFTVLPGIMVLDTLYIIEVTGSYTFIFAVYIEHKKLRKISYHGRTNHD